MSKAHWATNVKRAPSSEREYGGRTYDSKLEMRRAMYLDGLVEIGELAFWLPQVRIDLGPDFHTRVDFLCFRSVTDERVGDDDRSLDTAYGYDVCAEDVKGFVPKRFAKTVTLWKKYRGDTLPLHVVKKSGTGWTVERVA